MDFSTQTAEKLEKLGYKIKNTKDLFEKLPRGIFVTMSAKKMIQKQAIYMLTIKNNKYTFILGIEDAEESPLILNKISNSSLDEVLGKMIIFLEQYTSDDLNPKN